MQGMASYAMLLFKIFTKKAIGIFASFVLQVRFWEARYQQQLFCKILQEFVRLLLKLLL